MEAVLSTGVGFPTRIGIRAYGISLVIIALQAAVTG
jgi:hypothetical protein